QTVESLLEPRSNKVVPLRRQVADKQLECGPGLKLILHVSRRHREFVQVGEQPRKMFARHHLSEEIMSAARKAQSPEKRSSLARTLPAQGALFELCYNFPIAANRSCVHSCAPVA